VQALKALVSWQEGLGGDTERCLAVVDKGLERERIE